MSRASSYRATAADLRRSSLDLADLALLHRRLDAGTFGAAGPVATLHDRSVEAVAAMRAAVGPRVGVKASGGIRDAATARAMIEAGASRIGASASLTILDGWA